MPEVIGTIRVVHEGGARATGVVGTRAAALSGLAGATAAGGRRADLGETDRGYRNRMNAFIPQSGGAEQRKLEEWKRTGYYPGSPTGPIAARVGGRTIAGVIAGGSGSRGLANSAVRGGLAAGAHDAAAGWGGWNMQGANWEDAGTPMDPALSDLTLPGYAGATAAGRNQSQSLLRRGFNAAVARPVAMTFALATGRGVAAGVRAGARTYRTLSTMTMSSGAAFGRGVAARAAAGEGLRAGAMAFKGSLAATASAVAVTAALVIGVPLALAGMKASAAVAARTASRGTAYREALGAASLGPWAAGGSTLVGAIQQNREYQRERDKNRRAAILMDPRSYAGAATLERERYLQQREGAELRWPFGMISRAWRGVMGKEVTPLGAGFRLAGTRLKNLLLYSGTKDPVFGFMPHSLRGRFPTARPPKPMMPTVENISVMQSGKVSEQVRAARWNKLWVAGEVTENWAERQDELLRIQDPLYRAQRQAQREFAGQQRGAQPVSGQYNLSGATAVARTAQLAPDDLQNELNRRVHEILYNQKVILDHQNVGP